MTKKIRAENIQSYKIDTESRHSNWLHQKEKVNINDYYQYGHDFADPRPTPAQSELPKKWKHKKESKNWILQKNLARKQHFCAKIHRRPQNITPRGQ